MNIKKFNSINFKENDVVDIIGSHAGINVAIKGRLKQIDLTNKQLVVLTGDGNGFIRFDISLIDAASKEDYRIYLK